MLSKSQGEFLVTGYGFREISITVDLFRWKGRVALKSREEILRELIQEIEQRKPIGIMLHHKVMEEDAFSFLTQKNEGRRAESSNWSPLSPWGTGLG